MNPREIRSDAPVRILARCGSTDAESVVAAVCPFGVVELDKKPAILVDIFESHLFQRISTGRMGVLLTRVDGGPPGIAGANIQNHFGAEEVCPPPAVIAPLSIAAGRSNVTDGRQHFNA